MPFHHRVNLYLNRLRARIAQCIQGWRGVKGVRGSPRYQCFGHNDLEQSLSTTMTWKSLLVTLEERPRRMQYVGRIHYPSELVPSTPR